MIAKINFLLYRRKLQQKKWGEHSAPNKKIKSSFIAMKQTNKKQKKFLKWCYYNTRAIQYNKTPNKNKFKAKTALLKLKSMILFGDNV